MFERNHKTPDKWNPNEDNQQIVENGKKNLFSNIAILSLVNYGLFLTSQTSQFERWKKLSLAAVKQHNDLVSETESKNNKQRSRYEVGHSQTQASRSDPEDVNVTQQEREPR